jgi:large subunit ribosomal protein L23
MSVIRYPLGTEKSIRLMEAENKLIFMVDRRATKKEIKEAVEERFEVKVAQVRTHNTTQGKKALVTFGEGTLAIDVATKLGLM